MRQCGVDAVQEDTDQASVGPRVKPSPWLPPVAEKPGEVSNHRNGVSIKTVRTEDRALRIDAPRDRRAALTPLSFRNTNDAYPNRRDRPTQGYARSAGHRVSGEDATDWHCSSDPQRPGLRQLERPQSVGDCPQVIEATPRVEAVPV